MKIPKKLKIGGHKFSIVFKSNIDDDANCFGKTDLSKNIIFISEDQPQSQKEAVFFHEILHAINWELLEEEVEYLSQAFYQILKDNKLLKQ